MRPFAVGDMVIIYGHTTTIISLGIDRIYSATGNFYFDEVSAIRHPSKGNAESRAIVAMLARDANKQHNTYIAQLKVKLKAYKHDYENYDDFDDIEEEKEQLPFLIKQQEGYISRAYKAKSIFPLGKNYRKAKSMLK